MEDIASKKVECVNCGLIHNWSDRINHKIGMFNCYYCPKCEEESYRTLPTPNEK